MIVKWTADSNAHAYNLYRSEKPVSSLDGRIPIASRLTVNQFVDSGIDLDRTYYYSLTSVSPAGVEGEVLSPNVNLTTCLVSPF